MIQTETTGILVYRLITNSKLAEQHQTQRVFKKPPRQFSSWWLLGLLHVFKVWQNRFWFLLNKRLAW